MHNRIDVQIAQTIFLSSASLLFIDYFFPISDLIASLVGIACVTMVIGAVFSYWLFVPCAVYRLSCHALKVITKDHDGL